LTVIIISFFPYLVSLLHDTKNIIKEGKMSAFKLLAIFFACKNIYLHNCTYLLTWQTKMTTPI